MVRKAAPGTLALYLLIVPVAGVLPVAIAWLTKLLIDELAVQAAPTCLLGLAAGLSMITVVMAATPHLMQYLRAQMDRRVGVFAQDRLFRTVNEFVGLGRFEDPRFLDRLQLAQQIAGTSPYPNQVIEGLLGTLRAALTIGGMLGSLTLLDPLSAVLVLSSGVPVLVAEVALSRRRAQMLHAIVPIERRELFYSMLLSSVEAAKEVRLFSIGTFLRQRMLQNRRSADASKRALDQREVLIQTGLGLTSALVSGGGLLWAVYLARAGDLSIGAVALFVAAVAGVQGALATMASEVSRAHQALAMFSHYLAVTTAGPDLPTAGVPRALPPLHRGIELRDVWFRYSNDTPWVLRGVSLRIEHGEALAVVGLNGAGKSTLVKLLCRFYDPTRGAILWDGIDLREVAPEALRQRVSAVFQDYMHYHLSAAENIAVGDLTALTDAQRITSAARRAGIHGTLTALPHGYDTLLSRMFFTETEKSEPDTGIVLSGGQWQRLALARAFLRAQCDLVILDEPSAGLDAAAEYDIHSSLKRYRGQRTSLLISHRLSAVRDADRIVVLSSGRLVEQGSHTALMANGGPYAHLFTLQAAGYEATAHHAPDDQEQS